MAGKKTAVLARQYLVSLGLGFHEVTSSAKAQIRTTLLGRFPVYSGAYDLIKLPRQLGRSVTRLTEDQLRLVRLVEVKSSDRDLPNDLRGYFFSLQYAEQLTAQALGDRYLFAFVVTPRGAGKPFHHLLSWKQIWAKARSVHMQWSIRF